MTAFDFIREKLKTEKEDKQESYEIFVDRKMYGMADVFMGKVAEVDDVLKIIDEAEKEYNNGWIPCSEKMPADCGEDWVQVQIKEKDTGFLWIPRTAEYRKDKWWLTDSDEPLEDVFEVIAWQPLPEPYKEE